MTNKAKFNEAKRLAEESQDKFKRAHARAQEQIAKTTSHEEHAAAVEEALPEEREAIEEQRRAIRLAREAIDEETSNR